MTDMTPRAMTEEEVRNAFLEQVRAMVRYWASNSVDDKSVERRLDGLAFSILVILDGGSALPGFTVTPNPHESDKSFHIAEGENWWPDDCDIAGSLHERFYIKDKEPT